MDLYSIKMRSSKNGAHISGAERILPSDKLSEVASSLCKRALKHDLGQADFINIKMQAVREKDIKYVEALPVSTLPAKTIAEAYKNMQELLDRIGLSNKAQELIELVRTSRPMRGAILYDIAKGQRLEEDQARGIRVSNMDNAISNASNSNKNHFLEALVLASKVCNAPGVLAELCISDDPNYTTGYIASKELGYVRLMHLKEVGDKHGGRVFVFDSRIADPKEAIEYLEKQCVLVKNMPTAVDSKDTANTTKAKLSPTERLEKELARLKHAQLYRYTRAFSSAQAKYTMLNGRRVLLMSSNSYLDLADVAEIKEATIEAIKHFGTGSGGSRLTTGTMTLNEELEEALASFKHTEAALLFNTGYMANLGIISALADSTSVIFSDEYNHASIIDGARLSKAKIVVYKHNDMLDLEGKIKSTPYDNGIIVSDAVFSMDGDIASLPEIVSLGKKYGLLTMLDEAHSTGVIGATGGGIVEHFMDKANKSSMTELMPDILMGTLSKSLASEGGYACASRTIIEYLKNKARSFIFSTSQTPASLAAALAALKKLQAEPNLAQNLQENLVFFLDELHKNGIAAASPTAIIPIIIGDEEKALKASTFLLEHGIVIPAIRYPTVAKGSARLRVTLMSSHTHEELANAAKLIAEAIQ